MSIGNAAIKGILLLLLHSVPFQLFWYRIETTYTLIFGSSAAEFRGIWRLYSVMQIKAIIFVILYLVKLILLICFILLRGCFARNVAYIAPTVLNRGISATANHLPINCQSGDRAPDIYICERAVKGYNAPSHLIVNYNILNIVNHITDYVHLSSFFFYFCSVKQKYSIMLKWRLYFCDGPSKDFVTLTELRAFIRRLLAVYFKPWYIAHYTKKYRWITYQDLL